MSITNMQKFEVAAQPFPGIVFPSSVTVKQTDSKFLFTYGESAALALMPPRCTVCYREVWTIIREILENYPILSGKSEF